MAGILGDGNAFLVKRLLIRSRKSSIAKRRLGREGEIGEWGKVFNQGHWDHQERFDERRSSGDAAEENKFLSIEIAILKTAGGNKGLDWS